MQTKKYDYCIIGSGAGAGPIIFEMAKAGFSVLVLEKGPWIKTKDFSKDELVSCRRDVYIPSKEDEFHVIESQTSDGEWQPLATRDTNKNYWNGSCVGGSSNFMSAYFHRLKPNDFRLLSEYGPIEGANIVDWPISYDELEPYYTKVESVIGISGEVRQHTTLEPRSTSNYPYPPLKTNIVSEWIDKAGMKEGYQMVNGARGILSKTKDDRSACYNSNYCGSYGCSSDAKGSSRVALLNDSLKYDCTIIPNAKVFHLEKDGHNNVVKANYYLNGDKHFIEASTFVVACQAIETSRLLLNSKNKDAPNGLGNENSLVGKNLVFSAGGIGGGNLYFEDFSKEDALKIKEPGVFVNRAIQEWYEIKEENSGTKLKGGTIDFLFEHTNAIPKLARQKWKGTRLVYGSELKKNIHFYFTKQRKIKFEIFNDWLPTDDCYVELDEKEVDKWGDLVAKVRVGFHPHDIKIAKYLAVKGERILERIGAKNISTGISGEPSPNLVVGGCRFGENPNTSVLDKNCKVHSSKNLYVTDGSFMPTGGSVPHTWTIYANSFRVADHLLRIHR